MTEPRIKEACSHPDCGQEPDDHPKFHLFVGIREAVFGDGAATQKLFHQHDADQDGWVSYHHDCAASLPGPNYEKARIIVSHTLITEPHPDDPEKLISRNARGEELLNQLVDSSHPVHAAVAQHSLDEVAAAAARAIDADPVMVPRASVTAITGEQA